MLKQPQIKQQQTLYIPFRSISDKDKKSLSMLFYVIQKVPMKADSDSIHQMLSITLCFLGNTAPLNTNNALCSQ